MRKIILMMSVSLDGFFEGPDVSAPVVEFAGIWRDVPKYVYSRTLQQADLGWNSTLVRDVVPAEVAALRAAPGGDRIVGGARLAADPPEGARMTAAPDLTLDSATALVLIDLQQGILALPTTRPADLVLKNGIALAEAFRAHRLPVVLVRVAWSPDGGDLPVSDVDRPGPATAPPAAFSEIPAELAALGDVVVTKRHWGAFTGTELDLQLRRRGVHRIVLAGISTSVGVESTARTAWEHSYGLVFAEDATADTDPDAHAHSFGKIFPRIGRVSATAEIIAALNGPGSPASRD